MVNRKKEAEKWVIWHRLLQVGWGQTWLNGGREKTNLLLSVTSVKGTLNMAQSRHKVSPATSPRPFFASCTWVHGTFCVWVCGCKWPKLTMGYNDASDWLLPPPPAVNYSCVTADSLTTHMFAGKRNWMLRERDRGERKRSSDWRRREGRRERRNEDRNASRRSRGKRRSGCS